MRIETVPIERLEKTPFRSEFQIWEVAVEDDPRPGQE
jgi:hypothetical protein